MKTPELPVLLSLYAQIAPGELFRVLQRNLGLNKRDGIYTPRVLIWMMMLQHLRGRATVACVVEQLALGQLDGLLSRCKRVRERKIAPSTGGYCQARQNLPRILMERSVEEIIQRLRNHLGERMPLVQRPVYVVDGSSLQLEAAAELKPAYPPARNPRRPSHWPILRLVVLHDVETGLAHQPCWGPMYGSEAVSEQVLAERALQALPPGAVLIADRNFGIFAVAHSAHQNGQAVVVRLSKQRARRLLDRPLDQQGVYEVEWKPSRHEQAKHGVAATAVLRGRLIVWRVGRGQSQQWLYLFTTLSLPAEEVVELYGKRWNIETDLRSLKQTLRLSRLSVQSVDMMEKTLLAAVLAYNLIRSVMCVAARKRGLHSRQLSFTYAYNIVQDGITSVLAGATVPEQIERLERMVDLVARCKLPTRQKARSFPRQVWGRGRPFPSRTEKMPPTEKTK